MSSMSDGKQILAAIKMGWQVKLGENKQNCQKHNMGGWIPKLGTDKNLADIRVDKVWTDTKVSVCVYNFYGTNSDHQ